MHRLRELGWVEGRTVAIEYRWAEGRYERFSEIVAEFVRLKVDVIVTSAPGAAVAKELTSVIPIIFPTATDPIGSGLVAGLARPAGNATGLSLQMPDLASKRIELLREIVPGFRRLAILCNVGNAGATLDMRAAETAAGKLTNPHPKISQISPIFIADNVNLAVSRERDGKLRGLRRMR